MSIRRPSRTPHPAKAVLARLEQESRLRTKSFLGYGRSLNAEQAFDILAGVRKPVQVVDGEEGEWVASLDELLEVDSFIEGGENHVLPEDQYTALRLLAASKVLTAEGKSLSALQAYRQLKAGNELNVDTLQVAGFSDLVAVSDVAMAAQTPDSIVDVKVEEDYIMVGSTALDFKH